MYTFAVPYLYDANDQHHAGVRYQVTPGEREEESILRFSLDQEWLQANERAYPVVIDPVTITSKQSVDIEDTFTMSGRPNESEQYHYGSFVVGRNGDGINRAYIRFKNLPDLDPGDIIYHAKLSIWQYGFSAVGTQSFRVTAHEPKGNWNSSTTWNNQPGAEEPILDYVTMKPVRDGNTITYTQHYLDITKLVRGWYNTGVNNGIVLQSEEEDRAAEARFYASENLSSGGGGGVIGTDQYPSGLFYYRNASGTSIEDEIGRDITYSYDSYDNLTEITYPDGTKTTFSYDGHKLTKVTSPDGYSVCYEYTDDMRVPRVSKIEEKGGEETGQSMEISYKNGNTTVFEDCELDGDLGTKSDNITMTYHFSTWAVPTMCTIRTATPTIMTIIQRITGMMMLTTTGCGPRERPRQR